MCSQDLPPASVTNPPDRNTTSLSSRTSFTSRPYAPPFIRTNPPTVPGIDRRNSTPPMPASRAFDETRMPDAPPPHLSVVSSTLLDLCERLAEPHDDTRHATVTNDHVRSEPERHHRDGRIQRRRKLRRSDTSFGSNSHSALPPDLNHTSGASGASAVTLPPMTAPSAEAGERPEARHLPENKGRQTFTGTSRSHRPGRPPIW